MVHQNFEKKLKQIIISTYNFYNSKITSKPLINKRFSVKHVKNVEIIKRIHFAHFVIFLKFKSSS